MKICVLVKQVPDKNDEIKLDQNHKSVDRNNFNFVTNESDNYAVEEALNQRKSSVVKLQFVHMGLNHLYK